MLGFESLVPKGYGRIKKVKNNILEVIEEKILQEVKKTKTMLFRNFFCGKRQNYL